MFSGVPPGSIAGFCAAKPELKNALYASKATPEGGSPCIIS